MFKVKILWLGSEGKAMSIIGTCPKIPKVGSELKLVIDDLSKIEVIFGSIKEIRNDCKGLLDFYTTFGNFEFLILEKVDKYEVIDFSKYQKRRV
jgi:hypothetical protein